MSHASIAFRNGRVFTGRPDRPFVEAVAMSGERVIAVGTNNEIDATVGPGTETVDLAGVLLTPGFTDAHVHTVTSGLEQLKLTFDGCANATDAFAAI
ncbi:MAG: amidohydrolase, partial [Acidimicrobiia bacterium]